MRYTTPALDIHDNVWESIRHWVETAPDLPAIDQEGTVWSYGQLGQAVDRLTYFLGAHEVAAGDRVLFVMENSVGAIAGMLAAMRLGAWAIPLNARLSVREIDEIRKHAGPRLTLYTTDVSKDALAHADRHGAREAPSLQEAGLLYAPADGSVHRMPSFGPARDRVAALIYTSGTTGNPKGVIRSHRGMAMLALVTELEVGIGPDDDALLVMPMCHANSLNFFCSFSYCGGTVTIYSRKSFDAAHALDVLGRIGSTFTSLVPTHYIMLLGLSSKEKQVHDLGRMKKLMISSAAARADTKRGIMEMFPSSGLFELYGSSEAGWVTMLHPHEQFTHLGTVGRECIGSGPIRLLDDAGDEVPDGQPGELFSQTPYTFNGYWNQPDKTREAFNGDACSVGDMAVRDEDGFIRLVDRKKNMIISGGENIYPSEVEAVLGSCPQVRDVAVIGVPDDKWGEAVHAVVVLHDGESPDGNAILQWCDGRIAGYKKPRSVSFICEQDMPRTATGKVLHRVLRDQLGASPQEA